MDFREEVDEGSFKILETATFVFLADKQGRVTRLFGS